MTNWDRSIGHDAIVDWCFDNVERPDLWADLHGTKAALADVITDLHSQFAARKAEFSAVTQYRMHADGFHQVKAEYDDWKRRTTYVKSAVEARMRDIKIALSEAPRVQIHQPPSSRLIVDWVTRLHKVLGEFLDEVDGFDGSAP